MTVKPNGRRISPRLGRDSKARRALVDPVPCWRPEACDTRPIEILHSMGTADMKFGFTLPSYTWPGLDYPTTYRITKEMARRAEAQGKSVSQVVREILEEAVAERSLQEKIGHLKGRLRPAGRGEEPWRRRLRERNWRS